MSDNTILEQIMDLVNDACGDYLSDGRYEDLKSDIDAVLSAKNEEIKSLEVEPISEKVSSPLDIEINEGLFDFVIRLESCVAFTSNNPDGEEPTIIRIYANGVLAGDNVGVSPAQFNEIIRVREALGWTGKE